MDKLKIFTHINAKTVDEAASALAQYGDKAKVIAGGTDLLGVMKDRIWPTYPEVIVNLKTIPGLDYIKEEGGVLKIGALAKLEDISQSAAVTGKYSLLAQAASDISSPQLRNMGTIGGNLCQECRCWYYRATDNYFFCFRKGGALCFAVPGDNRYNAILGGQVCFAVVASDTSIALTALGATIVTNKRSIPISDFYEVLGHVLEADEIVTEVQVPEPQADTKQAFLKYRQKKVIDFALASAAVAITGATGTVSDARIVLGGVAPIPWRATAAEDALKGKAISESVAEAAGAEAVKDAFVLSENRYKIQLAKTMVKRAILA